MQVSVYEASETDDLWRLFVERNPRLFWQLWPEVAGGFRGSEDTSGRQIPNETKCASDVPQRGNRDQRASVCKLKGHIARIGEH